MQLHLKLASYAALVCGFMLLAPASGIWAQSAFVEWQVNNAKRNIEIKSARVSQLENTIQRLDQIGESRGREAQNMAVRVNTAYLSAQSTFGLSAEGSYERLGSKAIDILSGELQRRAKSTLTGGAARIATGVSGVGTVGTAAIELLSVAGKVVEYRESMRRYSELKRIQTLHQSGQVLASTFAAERRAELRNIQDEVAAYNRTLERINASGGDIGDPVKGVRIHFDDRILARALGRFGDSDTDADFARIQEALYNATNPDQIGLAFRQAANNEKTRFIRETKNTVSVDNVVLVSLKALAQQTSGSGGENAISLGGATRIYGFVLVSETNDVVLVGGVDPGVPPIAPDDLVTALRTVWKNQAIPTVSLDPDPNSPVAPQRARVNGIPHNSNFAHIMLEADYLAKRITLGELSVTPKIPGLITLPEALRDEDSLYVSGRIWLTPEQPDEGDIQISIDEDVVLFETAVRLLTEEMQWVGKIQAGTGRINPAMERTVESFTKQYDELERRWPVFRRLHALFDLVMLSQTLYQLDVDSPAISELAMLPSRHREVQKTFPAVLSEHEINGRIINFGGGVVAHNYVGSRHLLHYDMETMDQLKDKAASLSLSGQVAMRAQGVTLELTVPSGRSRYFLEGMRTAVNGQNREAETLFTRVIDEDPYYGEAYAQRALARYNLGRVQDARDDFDRAIDLLPGDKMLQVMSYLLRLEMGMKPSDIEMDNQTKAELANLMRLQAESQYENGDGGASIQSLNLALTFNPENTDALALRAFQKLQLNDSEGAYRDADKAIGLAPDFARAYTIRGTAAINLGAKDEDYYEDAFEDFTMAIELAPLVPEWWFNRARIYQHWGNRMERDSDLARGREAAISRYTGLIKDQPERAVLYLRRGMTKVKAGQISSGIEDYTLAIGKAPDMALAYVERAGSFHTLERYQEALADATKAIQLDSNFARGYASRCAAFLKIGRQAEALRDCDAAIRLDFELPYAYLLRGLIRQANGDITGAKEDWETAKRVDPDKASVYQQLIDMTG